jgi:hypothetical protein
VADMASTSIGRRIMATIIVAGLAVAPAAAQKPPVVSFERATELTKTYPFTRFSRLASFDVPLPFDLPPPGVKPQLPDQLLLTEGP